MTNSSIIERKNELRKAVRATRKLGHDCGDAHSIRLIELIVRNEFDCVSAYFEFDNEPSLEFMRSWCQANGVRVLLPEVINEYEMVWHEDTKQASLDEAQLVIMPALAAGLDGNRLGRGKGYYDKALQNHTAPRAVVVHDNEVFSEIPAEAFDQKVSMIVTCSETIAIDERLN